ncbi:FAD-dependent oxidoreductase [Mesorhizobium waimense]|uniref:FAD-dependent oxidoreductase n=1 Tax=Mesorhizobium waimense TaxID=1300307 RepID=A0A3A5JUN2_9HYPH|nr:NAD(P)/FAD-dependent oxidoreductase [Mesorhizobium waimense]RJT26736.1 FAD-dependent oxidoreductase [Mesorhizobium waimense]
MKYDVVIIGAGFAGVIAARELRHDGHKVLVLEGRDRIGGRTRTEQTYGVPLELGGTYLQWSQPHVFREILRYKLELSPPTLRRDKRYWIAGGKVHSGAAEDLYKLAAPGLEAMLADAQEVFPYPYEAGRVDITRVDRESYADRYARISDPLTRDLASAVLSEIATFPEQQSITSLLRYVSAIGNWQTFFSSAGGWRLKTGTKSLIEAIADESRAEFRLSTPVAKIVDDGTQIVATTRAGDSIQARAAIVAVPINTLHQIDFSPGLRMPTKRLVEERQPNLNFKLWALVRGQIEPFGASAPIHANPLSYVQTEYQIDGDTLVTCFGADRSKFDIFDRNAVQNALRAYVPGLEVIEVTAHDWVSDEFSQGTWATLRPGQLSELLPDIQRPHGRIAFAGADIAQSPYIGWIEGAFESGSTTARSVSQSLLAGR